MTKCTMRCDHHDEHDQATDKPTGKRCEARATHVLYWSDGRYSMGCDEHLEIEPGHDPHLIGIEAVR